VGTGGARTGEVVHWSGVRRMVGAWVLTVPAAGLVGAIAEETVSAFASATLGVIVVAAVTAGILPVLFAQSVICGVPAGFLAVLFGWVGRGNAAADNVLDGIAPAALIDEPVVPIL